MSGEYLLPPREISEFGMVGFDFNVAFQAALTDIADDSRLALDDKIRRMENIVAEGSSELYRDFIDFRDMAAQMQMMCSHDHWLASSMADSETLSGFINDHGPETDHEHSHIKHETNTKTEKKTKKKKYKGWLSLLMPIRK